MDLWHPRLNLWWPWSWSLRAQFLRTARLRLKASRRLREEQRRLKEALHARFLRRGYLAGHYLVWRPRLKLWWIYSPGGLKRVLGQTKGRGMSQEGCMLEKRKNQPLGHRLSPCEGSSGYPPCAGRILAGEKGLDELG